MGSRNALTTLRAQFASGDASSINPRSTNYGAKGDGITDDTAAIQAAINAASPLNERDEVLLPPGFYRLTSSLVINASYVTLAGCGRLSTMLFLDSGVADVPAVIRVGTTGTVQEVMIRDLAIEAGSDKGHTTGNGINVDGHCNIRDVYIAHAPQDGLVFSTTSQVFQTSVEDAYINLPGRDGVVIGANHFDCDFTRVYVRGGASAGAKGGRYGFYNKGMEQHFFGCHPYFMATDGLRGDAGNVQILGGEYESCGGNGITLTTQTQMSTVQGVTGMYANGCDIFVSQNGWPMLIKGNVLRSSAARNMWLDNTNDCIIEGNAFYAATTESVSVGACARGVLKGNVFLPATGATRSINLNAVTRWSVIGNVMGGSTPKPIQETGASDRNNISGNQLNGTTVTIVGANSVQTGANVA